MSNNIPALLQPLKDRLAAATPGPWKEYWQGHIHAPASYPQAVAESICQTFGREDRKHPNADFIAHAPTDQAKLIAAIEAVLAVADRWEEDFPHKAWQVRAALTQALGGDTA